jgi:hypothetical protein
MKVIDLIEFLEYSERTAAVTVGVVGADGRIHAYEDVSFLNDGNRVFLVAGASGSPDAMAADADLLHLADLERPWLFGQDFVLLRKATGF